MELMAESRTPEEIRQSIAQTRQELVKSIDQLRSGVERLSDWRSQIINNRRAVLVGAAVTGFVIAGGIAAIGGLFRRNDV